MRKHATNSRRQKKKKEATHKRENKKEKRAAKKKKTYISPSCRTAKRGRKREGVIIKKRLRS
jgi:hypothetical protein